MTRRGPRDGGRDGREAGQGLAVEGVGENRLHRVVAILADRERAGAGGVQPGGAVALAQAQDALGATEAIQRPIAEQPLDEVAARGADVGGARTAPRRRLQEEVDLVRRQVGGEGAPLAGRARRCVATRA